MPIYEYKCNECDKIFELITLSGNSEEKIECPSCKSNDINKLISAGSIRSNSTTSFPSAPQQGCGGNSRFS
ncbi:MAG: zinc ribbon domain-containing protein [Desulfobulbaceae bacterium]|nr:zinc ribbon domain-containing protein [Desulfobulbaceae bacterium]